MEWIILILSFGGAFLAFKGVRMMDKELSYDAVVMVLLGIVLVALAALAANIHHDHKYHSDESPQITSQQGE